MIKLHSVNKHRISLRNVYGDQIRCDIADANDAAQRL